MSEPANGYGLDNLPYASLIGADGSRFAGVRYGDAVLDLVHIDPGLFADGTLTAFLAAGPATWAQVRAAAQALIESDALQLRPLAALSATLGYTVADYVDFYASEHHATNAGRIFRPNAEALPANWRHLPIGYHGRSGSLVASGTPIRRPAGILGPGVFAPSARLDFEAELAFVVGVPGSHLTVGEADVHVFGVSLLNDWSARDIQGFETVPLGPFLGKSFATSISPWITPLAALSGRRVLPGSAAEPSASHLAETAPPHGLDVDLEIRLNGNLISAPHFREMHWSYAQMLAYLTSNGASVRTGDVFASGTVSGATAGERGCLLELTWNGTEPITVDGELRTWLCDGDEVTISAAAGSVSFGEVSGTVIAV
jgi:fumarylacetoacetase